MEKQISAVEWLENEFKEMCKDFGGLHTDFIERFDQAKQMEKEQIIEFANNYGFDICAYDYERAEQYYNETFKSE